MKSNQRKYGKAIKFIDTRYGKTAKVRRDRNLFSMMQIAAAQGVSIISAIKCQVVDGQEGKARKAVAIANASIDYAKAQVNIIKEANRLAGFYCNGA